MTKRQRRRSSSLNQIINHHNVLLLQPCYSDFFPYASAISIFFGLYMFALSKRSSTSHIIVMAEKARPYLVPPQATSTPHESYRNMQLSTRNNEKRAMWSLAYDFHIAFEAPHGKRMYAKLFAKDPCLRVSNLTVPNVYSIVDLGNSTCSVSKYSFIHANIMPQWQRNGACATQDINYDTSCNLARTPRLWERVCEGTYRMAKSDWHPSPMDMITKNLYIYISARW